MPVTIAYDDSYLPPFTRRQVSVVFGVHDLIMLFFFFFQAEDGIRDSSVTGVQTCALPIFEVILGLGVRHTAFAVETEDDLKDAWHALQDAGVRILRAIDHVSQKSLYFQIGRASCRERV